MGILLTEIDDEKGYYLEWWVPKVGYLAPALSEGVYGHGCSTRILAVETRVHFVGTVGETS